ncbi:MAG: TlpA disulfide reductase family protein [Nitriliruptoraceae bacterium]
MTARGLCVVLCLVLVLVACDEGAIDVADAATAAPPPRDAVLEPGGWPEAAAWIRRENELGRPVLVNIFASWCIPCRREMPLMVEAATSHPDIAFLGIDHLDQIDAATSFVQEMDIEFATLHDVTGDVAAAIGARGMPTTAMFDRDGRLVAHHTGEVTASQLDNLLDAVD